MALNLGEVFATIAVTDAGVAETLGAAQQGLQRTGAAAVAAGVGVDRFEATLGGVSVAGAEAAGGMDLAAASASTYQRSLTSTSAAADKLRVAQLRATAAQERYEELLASGAASTARLASSQATLISAQDRVTTATERMNASLRTTGPTAAVAATEGSAAFGKLAVSADLLAARSGAAFAGVRGAALGLVKTFVPIQNNYALAATAALAFAALSLHAVDEFQAATTRIRTQAGASTAEVQGLSAGMLHLAAAVGTTPVVLANAAYHIESVGLRGQQALDVLKIAGEGAKIGTADLTDVTNALDATIVSGIPGVKSYAQAMGVLNATVGAGDMTTQDLADALGTGVLAVIKGYGVTLQQASAALAVFGDNNIRAADDGTALRQSVIALSNPVVTAGKAFDQLGLSGASGLQTFSKDLQHGGLQEALTDLHKRLVDTGNTGAREGAILTEAFGKKAGVGLAILLGQYDRFENKLDEVDKGGRSFASDWETYTHTFSFAADQVKAAAVSAATALGDRLLPAATSALKWIGTDGVSGLTAGGRALHQLADDVGPVAPAFREAAKVAGDLIADLKPLGVILGGAGFAAAALAAHALGAALHVTADALTVVDVVLRHAKPEVEALAAAFLLLKANAAVGGLAGIGTQIGLLSARAKGAALAVGNGGSGLAGSLGALASPAGVAVSVLALATVAAYQHYEAEKKAAEAGRDYVRALAAFDPAAFQSFGALNLTLDVQRQKLQALAAAYASSDFDKLASLTGIADDSSAGFVKLNAAGKEAASQLAVVNAQAAQTADGAAELGFQFGITGDQVLQLANANSIDLSHGFSTVRDQLLGLLTAQVQAASTSGQLATVTHSLASATETAADKSKDLATQMGLMAGDAIDATKAQDTFTLGLLNMKSNLDLTSHSVDGNSAATIKNRDYLLDQLTQLQNVAAAQVKSTGDTAGATAQYDKSSTALAAAAIKAGLNAAQVNNLVRQYSALPADVTTNVHANTASAIAALATVKGDLAGLGAYGQIAGAQLAEGLARGIQDKAGVVDQAARASGEQAAAGIRHAIDSHSPSRVARKIGQHFTEGFALGIGDRQSSAVRAATMTAQATIGGLGAMPAIGPLTVPTVTIPHPAQGGAASGGGVQQGTRAAQHAGGNGQVTVRVIVDNPALRDVIRVEIDGADADKASVLGYAGTARQ